MLIITKNQRVMKVIYYNQSFKLCISSFLILSISLSCNENTQEAKIMTVKGEILAKQIGKTLPHEHSPARIEDSLCEAGNKYHLK